MQNAETLFLIDNDESQVFEDDVAGNKAMRANDNIHAALAQKLQDLALLALRAKAAQHFDSHRIIEHSLPERFEMLLCEHSRRREHRDLPSVHDRFERGTDRYFRFTKTDVATNQTVHGSRAFHVVLGLDDGFELIGRFAKWK